MPPPSSSENDLKRRARRRLIGAVALTLLAVIALPLLLEDEPPPASSLAVRMAATPQPKNEVAVPESLAEPAQANASVQAVAEPPRIDAAGPETPVAVAAQTLADEAGRQTAHRTATSDAPQPQADPKAAASAVAAQQKSPAIGANPAAPARPAAGEIFVVQLAALADAAKAGALKARATEVGLPAYTDSLGKLTRVRVGPYPSRAAAAAAAAKLAENGMKGQVLVK